MAIYLILLSSILMVFKTFIDINYSYKDERGRFYNTVDIMERFHFGIGYSSKLEITPLKDKVKLWPSYSYKRDKSIFEKENYYPYTYSGKSPYYVNYKGDSQYAMDQLYFDKAKGVVDFNFSQVNPYIVEINSENKAKKYIAIKHKVLLRGIIYEED